MRIKLYCLLFLINAFHFSKAQETVVLDTSMIYKPLQVISLDSNWIFHAGNNPEWAGVIIDTTGWKKFSPSEVSADQADKDGKMEGWFRLKFRLDNSFDHFPVVLSRAGFSPAEVYLDGHHIASFGNAGYSTISDQQPNAYKLQHVPLNITTNTDHLLCIHVKDHTAFLNPFYLRNDFTGERYTLSLTGPLTDQLLYETGLTFMRYAIVWISVNSVLLLLFIFLYFQNRAEKNYLLIAAVVGSSTLAIMLNLLFGIAHSITSFILVTLGNSVFTNLSQALTIIVVARIFKRRISNPLKFFLFIYTFASALEHYYFALKFSFYIPFFPVAISGYFIMTSWRSLKGSQWAVVAGLALTAVWVFLYVYNVATQGWPGPYGYLCLTGVYLSNPLTLLVYVAWRFKEILSEVRLRAQEVVKLSEEKKVQALNQQKILEEEVARQTLELRTSLNNLKTTQAQLIQSEKMASLGELTAGIAHEIQNPLNFVNNFSEVNNELIDELQGERLKAEGERDEELQDEIINDLKQNLEKINHHGKRADAIVKGMLEHSKTSTGIKEPTDINKLADEYLRLAYHGLRAKDKSFNAEIKTDFDEGAGKINIVPQDIGRVLLNLYNNAFYAVNEKQKAESLKPKSDGSKYEPTVTVSTKKVDAKIIISVKDNGNGIPEKIKEKIFQPFFTTKPTGSGTGLGLSLSYDIVKAHGGEIKVESKEGEGSEFIIMLPA